MGWREDKKRLDKIRGRDPRRGSSSSRRVRRGKEIKRDRERRLQEAREEEAREDRERERREKPPTPPPKPPTPPPEPEKELSLWDKVKEALKGIVTKVKGGFERAEEQAGGKLPGPLDIITKLGIGGAGAGLGRFTYQSYTAARATLMASKGAHAAAGVTRGGKLIQSTLGQAPAFQVNTKTAGLVKSFTSKIIQQFKKPAVVAAMLGVGLYTAIKESRSGEVLGRFVGMEEAAQVAGMPRWLSFEQAQETGDWDLYYQARDLEKALYEDQGMWDEIVSKIPWTNALVGLEKFRRAGIASGAIWDEMAAREQERQKEEQTEEDYWKKINDDKAEQEEALIDYYNQERKKLLKWEEEAKDRDMKEDAAFWAAEAAKQRKLEEEDRKAIAEFWEAYRKQKYKLDMDNRPSNLNFGLL